MFIIVMKYSEHKWQAFDRKMLFARHWQPEKQPKALIHIVHGMGEHSGRYHAWAQKFTEAGFMVLAMDYRGHGNSDGRRGHARKHEHFLKDLDSFIEFSNEHYPDLPRILYGHSFGGNLVINYFLTRYFRINGIVASSPWLKLQHPPAPFKLVGAKLMSYFYPGFRVSMGIRADQLTDIEEIKEKHRADDLVHNKISVRVLFDAMEAGQKALGNVHKINVPILCMHGRGDRITSYQACEDFVMNTSSNTTFKGWETESHELHNDPLSGEVFEYIINWMKQIGL